MPRRPNLASLLTNQNVCANKSPRSTHTHRLEQAEMLLDVVWDIMTSHNATHFQFRAPFEHGRHQIIRETQRSNENKIAVRPIFIENITRSVKIYHECNERSTVFITNYKVPTGVQSLAEQP
jgi:hypothetical protein